jgi:hypothetical protein
VSAEVVRTACKRTLPCVVGKSMTWRPRRDWVMDYTVVHDCEMNMGYTVENLHVWMHKHCDESNRNRIHGIIPY